MKARLAVLAGLVVVAVLTIWVAGNQTSPPSPPLDSQRLGPEPGEAVPAYLARARASLDAARASAASAASAASIADGAGGAAAEARGEPVWALVQLAAPLPADGAAALAGGARVSRVVFRVPLPRVQTALVTRDVPGQRPAAELADAQRQAAAERADAAARMTADGVGRGADVATAEAAALSSPGCACVLALLVRADAATLIRLAADPAVRAVHAATPGATLPAIAVSPLLPEQTDVAGPVPDDGPAPEPTP